MDGMLRLALGILLVTTSVAASAREQIPAEERWWPYKAQLPGCDDAGVISKIQSRFASKEANYWQSGLTITAVDRVQTTDFRANGLDLIPRRYCTARVHLSSGKTSPMIYSVIEDAGILGYSYGVHFCVAAYDRNWASAPECKAARP